MEFNLAQIDRLTDGEKNDFNQFLQHLIDMNRLDGASLGITKLVISEGQETLTDKQRFVFHREVIGVYSQESCRRCAAPVPWSEMLDAYDNGGLCGYCANMRARLDEE